MGPCHGPPGRPAARLSDRQREAVLVALELGYYERPGWATGRRNRRSVSRWGADFETELAFISFALVIRS